MSPTGPSPSIEHPLRTESISSLFLRLWGRLCRINGALQGGEFDGNLGGSGHHNAMLDGRKKPRCWVRAFRGAELGRSAFATFLVHRLQEGPVLSPALMGRFGKLGIEVAFDVYG